MRSHNAKGIGKGRNGTKNSLRRVTEFFDQRALRVIQAPALSSTAGGYDFADIVHQTSAIQRGQPVGANPSCRPIRWQVVSRVRVTAVHGEFASDGRARMRAGYRRECIEAVEESHIRNPQANPVCNAARNVSFFVQRGKCDAKANTMATSSSSSLINGTRYARHCQRPVSNQGRPVQCGSGIRAYGADERTSRAIARVQRPGGAGDAGGVRVNRPAGNLGALYSSTIAHVAPFRPVRFVVLPTRSPRSPQFHDGATLPGPHRP